MTQIKNQIDAAKIPEMPLEWDDLVPLEEKHPFEEYPLDALPEGIQAAIKEVSETDQAPIPLIGNSAISALSLAIQGHVDVQRSKGSKLNSPTSIFLLTIAESGERKSSIDKRFMQGIHEYQAAKRAEMKPLLLKYEAEKRIWEAKKTGIESEIKRLMTGKASKQTRFLNIGAAEEELKELESNPPIAPRIPQIIFSDYTPESLVYDLGHHWPSGGVVSSEAGIIFGSHGMRSESVMGNLSQLNILWDGLPLTVNRRTAGSFTADGVRLTMSLQTQEVTLKTFIEKHGELSRGSGFWARFLFAWPESTIGKRPFKELDSMPALDAFNSRIMEILKTDLSFDDSGKMVLKTLVLSPEAKKYWIRFHDIIEKQLTEGGQFCDIKDVAAKSADNAARLAGLFHVFEKGVDGEVGLDQMESACKLTLWHLTEARRFFGEQAMKPEILDAGKLEQWLIDRYRENGGKPISTRDVLQYGPFRKDNDRRESAYYVLEEYNHIKRQKVGRQKLIYLNPEITEIKK